MHSGSNINVTQDRPALVRRVMLLEAISSRPIPGYPLEGLGARAEAPSMPAG
jgi:hypothetical protein